MTRINCINPSDLTRQHLIAEYRELPRVFTLARKAYDRDKKPVIPDGYTLGKGHVTFFYDKLLYLVQRYNDLIDEMLVRGYSPSEKVYNSVLRGVEDLPKQWFNTWQPTKEAIDINIKRIQERLG